MSYPTVKSDPWKKGVKRRRRRSHLWTDQQWKRLTETAKEEYLPPTLRGYPIGPKCLALIRIYNEG